MSPSSQPTPPYTSCPPPSAYHSVWRGEPCRDDAVHSAAHLRRDVAPEAGGGCTSAEWTTRMVAGCASSLGSCTATMRSNGAAKIAVPSSTNACPPSHPREEKPNANSVEILIRPRIRRAQPGRPRSESACQSPMQRIGPAQCVLCECARVSAFTRSRRPVWPSPGPARRSLRVHARQCSADGGKAGAGGRDFPSPVVTCPFPLRP